MNQLVQKYLQRKSSAFKIKSTKTNRIEKHISEKLGKKKKDWKLKPSPYEQKLLTVQQKIYRTSSKTLKDGQLEQNNKANKDSKRGAVVDKKFQAQNSQLTPHFNLFKDEISFITRNECFRQISNETNYRVKSAINLRNNYKNTNYVSRPLTGFAQTDKMRQGRSAMRKSILHNDIERYRLHSQGKIIRKIIIFEKGIVIRNKK